MSKNRISFTFSKKKKHKNLKSGKSPAVEALRGQESDGEWSGRELDSMDSRSDHEGESISRCYVYHEYQTQARCAVHAINNLVLSPPPPPSGHPLTQHLAPVSCLFVSLRLKLPERKIHPPSSSCPHPTPSLMSSFSPLLIWFYSFRGVCTRTLISVPSPQNSRRVNSSTLIAAGLGVAITMQMF